eukprot:COSAG06_NODE_5594_length_3374_cov_102.094656_1_plen_527_part_00
MRNRGDYTALVSNDDALVDVDDAEIGSAVSRTSLVTRASSDDSGMEDDSGVTTMDTKGTVASVKPPAADDSSGISSIEVGIDGSSSANFDDLNAMRASLASNVHFDGADALVDDAGIGSAVSRTSTLESDTMKASAIPSKKEDPLKLAKLMSGMQMSFDELDADLSGQLDLSEFVRAVRQGGRVPPNLLSDADLHKLFSALDKDTSGDVSLDELRSFVQEADVGSEGSESSELSDPQPETAMASTSEHHSGGSSNVAIFRTGSTVSYNPMLTPASHGPDAAPSLDQRLRGLEAAAAKKAGGGGASGTLHVGGIQGDIEDETKLTELFSQFGAVETVTLRRRRGIKQGKQVVSWALVTFCESESVARALEAHASLASSHDLVVRTVDADQASSSTGAMSKVMQQHKSNQEGANLQKELAEAVDGFPTTIYVSSFEGFLAAHSVIGSVKDVDLDQAQRAAAEKLLAAEFRLKTEGVVKGVTISIDTERKLFALITFGNAIAAKLARFMVRTNMFDTHPLSQSILWVTF